MKRVVILLALGLFLLFIARYFFLNFSPFNLNQIQHLVEANNIKPGEWDILNNTIQTLIDKNQVLNYLSNNAYVAFGIFISGVFCIFIGLHLIIDKFFFKNFYEKASIFDAVRRGVLFCTAACVNLYLKLYGLDIQTILLINVFILAIELFFFIYIKPHLKSGVGKVVEFNKKVSNSAP
jgi:hypothetical protein